MRRWLESIAPTRSAGRCCRTSTHCPEASLQRLDTDPALPPSGGVGSTTTERHDLLRLRPPDLGNHEREEENARIEHGLLALGKIFRQLGFRQ